ncbi:MAG: CotH kinase family protein [Bacteroidota bacterium]|nr:CotH kinase family protein [Bacteroidota bacterium]
MLSILKLVFIGLILLISQQKVFTQVPFTSSNLPLVVINTSGQPIPDDPKIYASMGIIWNGPGKRNTLNDQMNNYNGKIGIEIRGSSSQMFPKKSYGIETKSNDLVSIDVSLLGMPEENDWILYAPYTDKTMIRDVLTYTLDATLGHYSPRCRFVELFLNGKYDGVYVLMEKIKRNKNRVDIAKLTTTDNSGEDLTGGYIIKIDKTTGSGGEGWYSSYPNTAGNTFYQYDYPKSTEITGTQKSYIQNYVRNMETALYQERFTTSGSYHEFLNDSSFIDFMIINELAKNVDGYRLSSYLYKGKNSLMNCGPIWDFNLGFGNADYYNGWLAVGFQYNTNLTQFSGLPDSWQNPFWWKKLLLDTSFVENLKKRWASLRKNELSDQRISLVTDSLANIIAEAQVRNYQRWPILGTYVWPNYFVGDSYSSEVSWMKNWVSQRLSFLDLAWPYDTSHTAEKPVAKLFDVFPNPFKDQLTIQLNSFSSGYVYAEVFSTNGSLLRKDRIDIENNQINLDYSGNNGLNRGLYLLRITHNDRILLNEKILKIK